MDSFKQLKIRLERLQKNPLFFWFSLAFLNILLFIPQSILNPAGIQWIPVPPVDGPRGWYDFAAFFIRRPNQDFFRIVAEYYFILLILFLTIKYNRLLWIKHVIPGIYLFLLIYHFYDAGMILVFGESPILYNDLMLLKGGFYLLVDIFFSRKVFAVLILILLAGLIIFLIPIYLKSISLGFKRFQSSRKFQTAGIILGIIIIINNLWFSFSDYRTTIQWISPKIISNVQKSIQLKEYFDNAVNREPDSTYYHFDQIRLSEKPNVYIFLIESYGRVLLENPETRPVYLEFMQSMQDSLESAGWKGKSTLSEAPIFGGRSWLSLGSIICGIPIKDQVIYSYFINHQENYPHLIHFFNQQGYQTIALQPLNRPRPGYSMSSYERFYQYDTYINAEDLEFDSPAFGFHNIPDQYSLNFSHEKYLKQLGQPYFLLFLTISSHSPWTFLPPYVKDWQEIQRSSIAALRKKYKNTSGRIEQTMQSNLISGVGLQEYLSLMFYELNILRDYILQKIPPNSIAVILGDHQPPIVTDQTSGFETPVHILSQDTVFLDYLTDYAFTEGIVLQEDQSANMSHAGLYSLLVRTLTQAYSDSPSLPPFLPEGSYLSIQRD
jgi:hypothetical protein